MSICSLRTTLAAAALAVVGCGFGFQRPAEVVDRRVLAIRLEPPEIIADGTPPPSEVQLSALVVDPGPGGGAIPYEWRSCVPAGLGGATVTSGQNGPQQGPPEEDLTSASDSGRCDAVPQNLLAGGEASWEQLSGLAVSVPVPVDLLFLAQQAASRGFAVPVYLNAQLMLAADATAPEPIYAYKRLVVSPPLPAGRTANRNPRLAALLFDGRPWTADEVLTVSRAACPAEKREVIPDPMNSEATFETCQHTITPAFDAQEAEPYRIVNFQGETIDLQERLRFAWYTDKGSFSQGETQQEGRLVVVDRRDPVSGTWREPQTGDGAVQVWVVVRDGRGGTSWQSRRLELVP